MIVINADLGGAGAASKKPVEIEKGIKVISNATKYISRDIKVFLKQLRKQYMKINPDCAKVDINVTTSFKDGKPNGLMISFKAYDKDNKLSIDSNNVLKVMENLTRGKAIIFKNGNPVVNAGGKPHFSAENHDWVKQGDVSWVQIDLLETY